MAFFSHSANNYIVWTVQDTMVAQLEIPIQNLQPSGKNRHANF